MEKTISIEVTSLFPKTVHLFSDSELVENVLVDTYTNLINDVYETKLVSTKASLDKLDYILKVTDPELRGTALACLGGVHATTGNYSKAFSSFTTALNTVKKPEFRAITYSELSLLLRKIGYMDEALAVIAEAKQLTKNVPLIWKLKTLEAFCHKYSQPELAIKIFSDALKYYQSKKNYGWIVRIHRHLGSVHINQGDFKKAEECLNKAMEIAIENSLENYQKDILNDKGWLLICRKEYDKARILFDNLIKEDLTPYLLSLALQNIGYLEFERNNYNEASRFHGESLRLATRYDMRDMMFEDYYKIGLCHQKLYEYAIANHFYQLGYHELKKEIGLGIKLTGYRKKLLETYIDFLQENQNIPYVDFREATFNFALQKTLKEIKYIFHKSLLSAHLNNSKNAPELCKNLDIDTRTYFLYQKKLAIKRGNPITGILKENPNFRYYIESLISLSWREANYKFEGDLFPFLLEKYQYSKKKMAETLNVSYSLIAQKTSL